MNVRRVILLVAIPYIAAFTMHALLLGKTVYGDGIYYYSWLRSLAVDHDVRFANEYKSAGVIQPNTATGIPANKYSIGPAVLWMPGYLMARPVFGGTGWEFPYQFVTGLIGVLAVLFSLCVLATRTRAPIGAVIPALILVSGATNLFFYGALDTVNSHAWSFFAATMYLALLREREVRHPFWIGVMLSVLSMIRLQDIVFIILLVPLRKRVNLTAVALGFATVFIPQLVAWYSIYGSLANPYLAGGERFAPFVPHILGVLFNAKSGLLLWTPIVGVGFWGLVRHRETRLYAAVFLVQLYAVSAWGTWWQGASFSGRMFVSVLPMIYLGLTQLLTPAAKRPILAPALPLLAAGICIVNLMGIGYFLLTT